VKVKGTGTDTATTGMRNAGSAESAELCTEKVGGTAKLICKLHRRGAGNKILAVDLNRVFGKSVDVSTHGCKDIEKSLNVTYGRNIVDDAGLLVKSASADDGKSSIFHAADRNVTVKGRAAVDDDLFHNILLNFAMMTSP
jgi:hypothetical protein